MITYRQEAVSGIFYKSSEKELKSQIKKCFLDKKFGPSNPPLVKKSDEFKAFIIPHAGYDYSGYCAAHAFRRIGENSDPEIIVLLGPNHSGYGDTASLYPEGVWMTPLGEVKVDKEFNELLLKTGVFTPDDLSHSQEHSLEVQLPFFKYVYGDKMPTIVPILISKRFTDSEGLKELGTALFKAWMKSSKRVLFIASSDFSHVGVGYGFIPFNERGKELSDKVKVLDRELIKYITELDTNKVIEYAKDNLLTVCGLNSIIVLINVLRNMKGKRVKGELLKHYTSGEVTDEYENFVDYASIEFKQV
ncbi:MAG: AmmeMemoRadiSam system protein B [Nanoarchaeota archaeon]|nr:AmmeMemoRadiSam system protein B [Nanoarchaeota archaeon]